MKSYSYTVLRLLGSRRGQLWVIEVQGGTFCIESRKIIKYECYTIKFFETVVALLMMMMQKVRACLSPQLESRPATMTQELYKIDSERDAHLD